MLSTRGGKTVLAGIILLITGALAKAFQCPYDNPILVAGSIITLVGILMNMGTTRHTDTGG